MKSSRLSPRDSARKHRGGALDLPLDRLLEEEWEFYFTLIEVCLQLPRALSLRSERAFGTPFTMAAALAYLYAAPKEGISMSHLSKILNLSNSRVSRLIHEMELAGWVEREKSKEDRRSSFAKITPLGRKKHEAERPLHIANIRELSVQVFTARERALLRPYLERLRAQIASNS